MALTLDDFRNADVFDSREVIERIEELEQALAEDEACGLDGDYDDERTQAEAELATLQALADEAGGEWSYGMTFVADSYFEDYAQELAEDLGYVDRENSMSPYIDWEKWARDVQMDYTPFELDGMTFWAR